MPDNLERAGALIMNKSMTHCVLVHQIKSQLWGVPKGRKDFKEETFENCMKREIKEEIDVNINELKHEILDIVSIHSKTKIYLIKLDNDDMEDYYPPFEDGKENHEIDKIEWVKIYKAINRKINSITRKTLIRAINKLNLYKELTNNKHNSNDKMVSHQDIIDYINNYYDISDL
jgi:8-oxo-dGTP pyrophosphatase MutT (NUDIX family)